MRKYNEIMKNIEVTEEMQQRILQNISRRQKRKRIESVFKYTTAIAACFAITFGAVKMMQQKNHLQMPKEENPTLSTDGNSVEGVYDVQEFESAEQLSQAFGVNLQDISTCPFEISEKEYTILFHQFAEVNYYGTKGEKCSIRIGANTEDISGDYEEYAIEKEIENNGISVTLKGNDNFYYSALWIQEGHFYSIYLTDGTEEQKMKDIVLDVMQ